ncbi:hypothetical protein SCLCIDRAFT_1214508 [Scleroderma citrinum Foug A]|uniref:Uncharacterized protein n=1 Tax=Scleroderma citrinum Foug A TaxID=1036808 RepID=A0A0C3DQP4_9AGAM|nr:hypothetical protein SCLCIDRAFT_1214508 [Scleroderma citrinum Foug A]
MNECAISPRGSAQADQRLERGGPRSHSTPAALFTFQSTPPPLRNYHSITETT